MLIRKFIEPRVGGAHLATTTIQEEDVYSLSSPTGGEGWGEEADSIEYPSPLTLSPLVPRRAREKISGGCIKMRPVSVPFN